MHQPGHSQRYFPVLLYLHTVLFFAWQKTYAPARTLSLVLLTQLCFVSRKKQHRGQGLKCTFLKYLLQICTSFFATKTHSQKPGHVDAFPLYPAVSYIILRPQLKPTEIRLVSYIAGQKPWGSLCTNLLLPNTQA